MVYEGVMIGNVWVHQAPDRSSIVSPIAVLINTKVELLAVYNGWVKISWSTKFGNQEGWVPQEFVGILYPIPSQLVTPVK
jgi:hypothetical protein